MKLDLKPTKKGIKMTQIKKTITKGIEPNNNSLEFGKESKDMVSSLNSCLQRAQYNSTRKNSFNKPVHFLKLLSY